MTFDGPHSVACYECLWLEAGCLRSGMEYPPNLPDANLAPLNVFNVMYVSKRCTLIKSKFKPFVNARCCTKTDDEWRCLS